jgi:hypothetical protein
MAMTMTVTFANTRVIWQLEDVAVKLSTNTQLSNGVLRNYAIANGTKREAVTRNDAKNQKRRLNRHKQLNRKEASCKWTI